jgi:hypothetical protein
MGNLTYTFYNQTVHGSDILGRQDLHTEERYFNMFNEATLAPHHYVTHGIKLKIAGRFLFIFIYHSKTGISTPETHFTSYNSAKHILCMFSFALVVM